jgi:hypothetical protein
MICCHFVQPSSKLDTTDQNSYFLVFLCNAAGLGLEPRYHPPEGCVLPLDDPAALHINTLKILPSAKRMENKAVCFSFLPLDDPAILHQITLDQG